MRYRVRIMDGVDQYDDSWDEDTRGAALDSARQYLRDIASGAIAAKIAGGVYVPPRDPFALINTISTDSSYYNEIHWPSTTSITLGPDGEEIR